MAHPEAGNADAVLTLPATERAAGLWLRGFTPPLKLGDFKLVAFDMDSTLIDIECVDEIADAVGRRAEVAALTEAAMQGQASDYRTSLRRRVALLRGVPESALAQIWAERLQLNPGVERFVQTCQRAGLATMLVSGGFTYFSDRVRQRLNLDFSRANALELEECPQPGIDGTAPVLTGRLVPQPWGEICDGDEKRRFLLEICGRLGIDRAQAIAVGDGANDLPMMGAAGLSIGFHPKPAVHRQAMVSIVSGGLDRALEVFDD